MGPGFRYERLCSFALVLWTLLLTGCESPALFEKRTEWIEVPGRGRVPVEIIEPSPLAKALGSQEIIGAVGLSLLSAFATWRNWKTRRELRRFAETGETQMWRRKKERPAEGPKTAGRNLG